MAKGRQCSSNRKTKKKPEAHRNRQDAESLYQPRVYTSQGSIPAKGLYQPRVNTSQGSKPVRQAEDFQKQNLTQLVNKAEGKKNTAKLDRAQAGRKQVKTSI